MTRNPVKGILIVTLPQILLIVVVAGLLVLMVFSCIKAVKGPLSTTALKRYLILLQAKFASANTIDPNLERDEMENLQNKIKTSCSALRISGDSDLKSLFHNSCRSIHLILQQPHLNDRTGWLKFNALMTDFKTSYFQA